MALVSDKTETPQLSSLKGASLGELERFFLSIKEPKFRARQAFRRINKHQARQLDEFTEFSLELRSRLREMEVWPSLRIIETQKASDGTEKFLIELPPLTARSKARQIEAVWIPSGKRNTLCISSQIGCTLNCTFCATGTLPFYGNLPSWAITEQVYEILKYRKERGDKSRLTNIVFMGMGEPFHNYKNVIRAARILNHPEGLKLGAPHITISTAGVIPSIERFIQDKEPFNLAVSLNHPDPKARTSIMDVNKKYPLDRLLKVLRRYTKERDRRVTFEYVMIPNVNMDKESLRRLIKIGRSVRSKINLIPLNTNLAGLRRPSPEEAHKFYLELLEAGLSVFNRGSPGLEANAACGMLALNRTS